MAVSIYLQETAIRCVFLEARVYNINAFVAFKPDQRPENGCNYTRGTCMYAFPGVIQSTRFYCFTSYVIYSPTSQIYTRGVSNLNKSIESNNKCNAIAVQRKMTK